MMGKKSYYVHALARDRKVSFVLNNQGHSDKGFRPYRTLLACRSYLYRAFVILLP